ncbi:hypothetical protein [Roseisalinus antarcticus]|uniref:Lipoprotein n=1 Tax=Roseisalinus antarcticus TaxID=254357 RepID=A0A1Y5TB52_9RHOB|nr:hypothetical protein [Roseisalinus antarcticus]SLN59836.1 hypothetical protein ROA7023_02753 [Roseisalinus antarcticus]
MRRAGIAAFCIMLSGCSETLPAGAAGPVPGPDPRLAPAASPEAGPESARAFFASYPELLLGAVAQSCVDPGQALVRPSEDEVRCESLPPVEAAAALILEFDGTVDNLPRFVTSIASRSADGGYVVTADNYIRVPLQAGGARIVRLPDPALNRVIRDVLERAGGRLL